MVEFFTTHWIAYLIASVLVFCIHIYYKLVMESKLTLFDVLFALFLAVASPIVIVAAIVLCLIYLIIRTMDVTLIKRTY